MRVLTTIRRAEYFELVVLFFIQGMAMGMWFVPLGAVLDAHDMSHLKPYAFATSALAAFVSPLVFGAMADGTLLSSARVRPAVLERSGFAFRDPTLATALRSELGAA